MLAKQHRLPVDEFSPRARRFSKGKIILAKTAPNKLGLLRVGVLASRKYVKKASARNALKRTTLDFFSPLKTGSKSGVDLLIIIAAPIIKFDSQTKDDLLQDLESVKVSLLRRATT